MKTDYLSDFGNTVRFYRKEQNLSQEQLAEKSGFHRTYIGQIERGERNPSLINIHKFALAFGIPISQLFKKCEQIRQLRS
ncbi:MAG: helix-turn-helix transcriptional regulator [Rikenellaceae bacterium]